MRDGFSVLEIMLVLVLLGMLLLIGLPLTGSWRDRLAVRRASIEIAAFYHTARHAAMLRATPVAVTFGEDSLLAMYEGVTDSVMTGRVGPGRLGVGLIASTPVVRIHPTGFGLGAANTKLVLYRGSAAESLTTSRLGRLKRWR